LGWPWILFVQCFCGTWSCICTVGTIMILYRVRKNQPSGDHHHHKSFFCSLPIKVVCLYLHLFTHIFRVVYRVDLYFSKRIFPYLASFEIYSASTIFQVIYNILLAFVLRELTHAKHTINMQDKVARAYVVCLIFVLMDFTIATMSGLLYVHTSPQIGAKAIYNLSLYLLFGPWYLYQAYAFLKKASKGEKMTNKKNTQAANLHRMSIINALGLMTYSIIQSFALVRQIYGNPTGYAVVVFFANLAPQLTSMIEIFLFGGIAISTDTIKQSWQRRFSSVATGSKQVTAESTLI